MPDVGSWGQEGWARMEQKQQFQNNTSITTTAHCSPCTLSALQNSVSPLTAFLPHPPNSSFTLSTHPASLCISSFTASASGNLSLPTASQRGDESNTSLKTLRGEMTANLFLRGTERQTFLGVLGTLHFPKSSYRGLCKRAIH